MSPFVALGYSLLFGLLHGVLPDEHTWPITFSYAIGGASGGAGMRAGLTFSAAFTVQRMIVAELAYLALAPFLLRPTVNGVVYVVVGAVMLAAGLVVLRRNRYPHVHVLGHHHEQGADMEASAQVLSRTHEPCDPFAAAPPVRWTLVHGFVAGFGFGGFSLFINTVAAPAMGSPWLGFLPGLLFGLGTMLMLAALGAVFGSSLRWLGSLSQREMCTIGARTGSRTLTFGGALFAIFGVVLLGGLVPSGWLDAGDVLIGVFMVGVALPALIFSYREVRGAGHGGDGHEAAPGFAGQQARRGGRR